MATLVERGPARRAAERAPPRDDFTLLVLLSLVADAAQKLRRTLPLVLGFFLGCTEGAAEAARLGPWAWAIPALLSLLALPLAARAQAVRNPSHDRERFGRGEGQAPGVPVGLAVQGSRRTLVDAGVRRGPRFRGP